MLPDIHAHEVPVAERGHGYGQTEAARVFGAYTADVLAANPENFRIFGPDETASNRLQDAYQVTKKQWEAGHYADEANDELLAPSGKVIEQLSEHQCEGFLEAYVLTGRHGVWSSYESFVHVVDSMVNQHCKWLEATKREIPWRKPIAGLNILLSSHVWRQDHNGFSHQDPGFIDLLLNKANDTHIVNAYYPCDANMALAVAERAYQSTDCVNAIFCGKQPAPTFVTVDEAKAELAEGLATWAWASTAETLDEADLVIATCGDAPTLEALAAVDLLGEQGIKAWFVNVVDLLKIQNACENDQAISDERFAEFFGTGEKPVLFCFHAYAGTIRRLVWARPGHDAWCVHGYEEKGSTTTPFDMLRLNNMDRWALAAEALRLVDAASGAAAGAGRACRAGCRLGCFPRGGLPLCRGGGLRPPGLHRLGVARRARRDRGRCCSRALCHPDDRRRQRIRWASRAPREVPGRPDLPGRPPALGGLRPRFATRAGEQPGRPERARSSEDG